MRAFKFITGHVIYNPAYTYKFQMKTTIFMQCVFIFIVLRIHQWFFCNYLVYSTQVTNWFDNASFGGLLYKDFVSYRFYIVEM